MSVPLAVSPGRAGFGPHLDLTYDSGSGNGPFGFGWSLSIPSISRKTDKGLPRYDDADESDIFILSGAEDLVPLLRPDSSRDTDHVSVPGFTIDRYRPRIEGLFARIERWTETATGNVHWRSISRDNITTTYGDTPESRIADGDRVFTWLICASYDDRGNAIVYSYVGEDDANVDRFQLNERNRSRLANRYLKRVRYGNTVSRLVQSDLTKTDWLFEVVFDYGEDHYEDVALDPNHPPSEQHRFVRASALPGGTWSVRPDPFSSYRSGFEVRTYRRCRRVMMFHRFPELGAEPYLVRATEFDYVDLDYSNPVPIETELSHEGSTRFASFIGSVTQSGFVRDETAAIVKHNGVDYVTYLVESFPPVEFGYSKAVIQDTVRELDRASLENLPGGVDGTRYQWVDLDGEGIAGVLTEQPGAWYYKPSLGSGEFGSTQTVATRPSLANLSARSQRLLDLAGDGHLDLVDFRGFIPGYYERTDAEDWDDFRPFKELPNVRWDDPNLRFVDLNGDGHADVLVTEDDALTWYPSLAQDGFAPSARVAKPWDDELGPRLLFADGTQSIYLADMSGDGLNDLARIRNGDICYWPNLGYGRFGAKVTMDNAPWLDNPDEFDEARVRLADIDGSGTSDLIYLGCDGVCLYFNQSGNRWSQSRPLSFPRIDNIGSVMPTDVLGNGTACLVWSTPLPAEALRAIRYVDLMGGTKPHLLVRAVNNFGTETRVQYAASTKFYLADKLAGTPWITRVPFPVHVVERVVTDDRVSRNRFVTRYAYHHGHYDGVEREFRGFGLVEHWDTEEFAAFMGDGELPAPTNGDYASHVPPVLMRTWFHTGVYFGRDHVSDFFAGLLGDTTGGSYYREPGLTDADARDRLLDDTVLPDGLTVDEEREACRALKGSMLRQELYALDGGADQASQDRAATPYTVVEQNFHISLVQPQAGNRHAVFFTHPLETLTYQYERDPTDPRVQHLLTLEIDAYGNAVKEATVGYGRRQPDPSLPLQVDRDEQARTLVTYTEHDVTNPIDDVAAFPDDHRVPVPCETRTFELTGYVPNGPAGRFAIADFVHTVGGSPALVFDAEIQFEESPTNGRQRRLVAHVRTLYRADDLSGLLPLGHVEPRALPGESYKLAFTPGLLTQVFQRGGQPLIPNPANVLGGQSGDRGGYLPSQHFKADGRFPEYRSERPLVDPGRTSLPVPGRERHRCAGARPRTGALLPYAPRPEPIPHHRGSHGELRHLRRSRPVGGRDPRRARQPHHRRRATTGRHDRPRRRRQRLPRTPALPRYGSQPQPHRSGLRRARHGGRHGDHGKPEENLGDSLAGFVADLTEAETVDHISNPLANPGAVLSGASRRHVYDLHAYYRTAVNPTPCPPSFTPSRARRTTPISGPVRRRRSSTASRTPTASAAHPEEAPRRAGTLVGRRARAPLRAGSGAAGPCSTTRASRSATTSRSSAPTSGFEFGVQAGVSPSCSTTRSPASSPPCTQTTPTRK